MIVRDRQQSLYNIDESGKLTLNLHLGQTHAWESKKRFVFMLAGTGSGKTSLLPWWMRREILQTAEQGGGRANTYLAVSATNDLFYNAFLPEMIQVYCDVLNIGHYWSAPRILEILERY